MSTDAKDFYGVIDNNEKIENTQIPTGTTPTVAVGWNKDSTKYTDGRGQEWNWNNGQLYNANGISWDDAHTVLDAEGNGVLGADGKYQVSEAAPVRPTGTTGGYGGYLTGGSTPVVTPSRGAGAAPSGYGDYLAGEGKAVQQAYDQAVAAAREEYARNRATFGARAESLGRAGLTGSGYGDYLEGKAFTAMQQKIGAAETAKAQSYADYLTQKEAQASSYAAYLSSEQQAEEEKMKTVANAIVYNARNKGVSSVTLESMILDAKAAGVTPTDEWLASIRADLESVGINVVTQAEASNESLYQTMVGYIEDGGPARTVDDLIAVIKTYDPNISDESARAIADRLAPTIAEKDKQVADENATIHATAIEEIKSWAVSQGSIPTVEQIQNAARELGVELSDEDMADISAHVKGLLGREPMTTSDAVKLGVDAWVMENAGEYDTSELMAFAMEKSGYTPEEIEMATASYYELHYEGIKTSVNNWDGSVDDLVAQFGAVELDKMIGKTLAAEQAKEIQTMVSDKLDTLFNQAFDSFDVETAKSLLGIEITDANNPDGDIVQAAYDAYSAGALSLDAFDRLLGKMVTRDIDNMGDNGEGEVTALMQTCGTIIDLIGEDEKLTALYKKYMEMCAKKIQKITYVEDFQEYGYKDLLLKVRIGGEEKSFSFGGTNSLVKGEDIQEKGENGDMVYKNGTLYICIGEENKWLPVKKLTGSGYLHTANERSEASVLYTLLSEVVKTRGRADSFFNQLPALTTAQNHYGITGKGAPGYR